MPGPARRRAGRSRTTRVSRTARRTRSTASTICTRPIRRASRTTPARSRCRRCGTRRPKRIVNNELSDIIRMLNSEFDGITGDNNDFYPQALRAEIDRLNDADLSERQQRRVSLRLRQDRRPPTRRPTTRCSRRSTSWRRGSSRQRYLVGNQITEADWRLFPTLVRFDVAYFSLFRATDSGSPTIRICRTTCASSTRCPASPRP